MNMRILVMCVSLMGLTAGPTLASSMWWQPYSSDANTIGLWHFDDVTGPTGTFADSSANANNGTFTANDGGVTLTVPVTSGAGTGPGAGMFGKSLNYSPSATPTGSVLRWGTVPDNAGQLDYGNAFTIEAWVKPSAFDLTGTDKETYFAGKRGPGDASVEWNLGLFNGKPYFEDLNGAYQSVYASAGPVLTADTWYHIAGVATNNGTTTTATIYLNGAAVATNSWADATGLDQNADPITFGNRGTGTAYSVYNGQLDEVRYSNVAREFGPVVPEPSSLALLLVGSVALLWQRGRR